MNKSLVEIRLSEETPNSQENYNEISQYSETEKIVQLREKLANLRESIEVIFQNLAQGITNQKKTDINNNLKQIDELIQQLVKDGDLTSDTFNFSKKNSECELNFIPTLLLKMKSSQNTSAHLFQKQKPFRLSFDFGLIQKIKQNIAQLKFQKEEYLQKANNIHIQLQQSKNIIQQISSIQEANSSNQLSLYKEFIKQIQVQYQQSKIEFNRLSSSIQASLQQTYLMWFSEIKKKQLKLKIYQVISEYINPNEDHSQSTINNTKFDSKSYSLMNSQQIDPLQDQLNHQESIYNNSTNIDYSYRYSILDQNQEHQTSHSTNLSQIIAGVEAFYSYLQDTLL